MPNEIGTTTSDLAQRSHDIRWPKQFEPSDKGSFAHNEILIRADCEQVWGHLVDVVRWPSWFILTRNVRLLNGASTLALSTRFEWQVLSYRVESEIKEFTPYSRLGWTSYTPGQAPQYYHAWLVTPVKSGCYVITEEVGVGPDAYNSARGGDTETHRVHDLWLASLRWISGS